MTEVIDPVKFIKLCWPDINLYDRQKEILYSLQDNAATIVPAGNMLGKDFISGLALIWFFYSRHPCRIVSTSVDETQLKAVLWGEIRRFLQTSKVALTTAQGGPLLVNDLHIRKVVNGEICGLSYLLGRVAGEEGEGFLGHHIAATGDGIPRTLFCIDEASGVPDKYFEKGDTWANRILVIGNTFECENYFKRSVKAGTTFSSEGDICYKKIIHIRGQDSPNVRYALAEIAAGLKPSNKILIPGVKSWAEYKKNREEWDEIKQMISLDAEFYEGSEIKMYPVTWLIKSNMIAERLAGTKRKAFSLGIDPGEGGANTVWTGSDKLGAIFQHSQKTPDTSQIEGITLGFMKEWGIEAHNVVFDRGGGGLQIADSMRSKGHPVRTVAFGEAATDPDAVTERARSYRPDEEKIEEVEIRYVYKNRRAQLYHEARLMIEKGFGIPEGFTELMRQLKPIPLLYDGEGRIYLPPKHKKDRKSKELTLDELVGCSPDEADSFVLSVFGLNHPVNQFVARAY